MPILIIDETIREEIRKVMEYAKEHPTTKDDLFEMKSGQKGPVGDDPRYVMVISNHYRVVYSQEHQIDGNMYHHLSVSVPGKDKFPSIPAFEMIMDEFGMGKNLYDCTSIWREDRAINVLKQM